MRTRLLVIHAVLLFSLLSLPGLAAAQVPDEQQPTTRGDVSQRSGERRTDDEIIDTAPEVHAAHEHAPDSTDNHMVGSANQVELIGQRDIRGQADGRVADVAAHGDYAYLTARDPSACTGPEAAGVVVFDISDPRNPEQVNFIPATEGSQPGEGADILDMDTEGFTGQLLVFNNEVCDPEAAAEVGSSGGITLYDVTDPLNPELLIANFGDEIVDDTGLPTGFFNDSHSAFAWQDDDRAYTVLVDNFETDDVDIVDITHPRNPELIGEFDLNEEGVLQDDAGRPLGEAAFLHDVTVKEIDGVQTMLLSYWDGGWVQMNVEDPANPEFIDDFDYPVVDAETGLTPSEGNAHQAEFSFDDRFIVGTDEDFSPYRSQFSITSGPNSGDYPGGEFGFSIPIANLYPDQQVNGPTVYGGLGCPGDDEEVPPASNLELAAGEESVVVIQRGACFFSEKIEAGQDAGYDHIIVANSHLGADFGNAPDAIICGSQGHEFTPTRSATCIGHRAFHLLFNTEPGYSETEDDAPPIGTLGEDVLAIAQFDGWGYIRLLNQETMEEIDTYAIGTALRPRFAQDFGDLTVHEVATDPDENLAYVSYYAGGFRIAKFGKRNIHEIAHYISEDGNDFWGVEYHELDGQEYILASDRDRGLWIFKHAPCTIKGTHQADRLRGTAKRDVICGRGGGDTIHGAAGHDLLFSQDADDTVRGNRGNDTIWSQAGHDRVVGGPGADELHGGLHADRVLGGSGADRAWGGGGHDYVHGGRAADELSGGNRKDEVRGGRGDDHVDGDAGDDLLRGGRGDDVLDGGPGVDRCIGGPGVDSATNCEYLVGIENDLGTTLTTSLTGAEEIDAETGEGGAGDPDGSGSATVTVSLKERTVCSDIAVADIGLPAAGAHIHEAAVGSNGPIVVTLDHPGDDGTASGCVEGVARSLLRDILIDPDHYYVNVHNAEYPAGAVRGQLGPLG